MSTPAALRRILDAAPPVPRPGEQCEMCNEAIPEVHNHVAQLDTRSLMCACRGCWLLFTNDGAAGGRYRAVPEQCLRDTGFRLTDEQWSQLQIPVSMAFFLPNSTDGRVATFYPSPAGATESEIAPDAWTEVVRAASQLPDPRPDVQAVLVRRTDAGFEAYLLPVDLCYELVGLVRMHWKGFDGGTEAHEQIEGFFTDLRERAGG